LGAEQIRGGAIPARLRLPKRLPLRRPKIAPAPERQLTN
jgi:hypothetical protein